MGRRKLMSGNDACVLGALEAGMNFFAGYPITPATEIAEKCSELLPEKGGTFIQMEDELGSICSVIGAALAGAKAMTATSGPGFSLMQEAIGYATLVEVPCVIIDVMRQGPSTGAPTLPAQGDIIQSIFGSHGDYPSIVLAPDSVQELYTETMRAFFLAHKLSTPVTILSNAWLAHMSELIELDVPHEEVVRKPIVCTENYLPYYDDGTGIPSAPMLGSEYHWACTGLIHGESGFPQTNDPEAVEANIKRLFQKIADNETFIESWEERFTDGAEDAIVVSIGSDSRCTRAAELLRDEGFKIGFFRPITLWPFPKKRFAELASKTKHVIVCESSMGQLELLCRANAVNGSNISGIRQTNGCILSEETILNGIKEILRRE